VTKPGKPATQCRLCWDRGTLILTDPQHVEVVQELPGVVWDPRTSVHRAPGWRYYEIKAAIAEQALPVLDDVIPSRRQPTPTSAPTLRHYQAAAVAAWRAAEKRGIMVLPTGAGKTRTAAVCIATLGMRTLVLVPTRVLLEQWWHTLSKLGFAADDLGRYGDGVREERPITISTFASAKIHMAQLGCLFDLLIVDECHHFGSGFGDEALEMCSAPARLGLTATPPEEAARIESVGRLVGPVVCRSTIDDLSGVFLAPFDLVTLQLRLSPEERATYDEAMSTFRPVCRDFFSAAPQATWPQFVAAAMRNEVGQRALAAFRCSRKIVAFASPKRAVVRELLRRHQHQHVLVFTADNEAAYHVALELLVMPITCDIGRAERADALGRFAEGKLTTLVSARVLNEGLDVPSAEVAILVAGAHGSREYVQRVGRVLRPAEGKQAVIYELVIDNTHEMRELERGRRRLAAKEPATVPSRW
jgi:superfamily II DNA or RNA helicase